MTQADDIDPKFYTLLSNSEALMATARLKRESEPFDWKEISRLHKEIDRMHDEMTAMLPDQRP